MSWTWGKTQTNTPEKTLNGRDRPAFLDPLCHLPLCPGVQLKGYDQKKHAPGWWGSLGTSFSSAEFHEDMGFISPGHWCIPSAWLVFTAQLNIWEWIVLSLWVIIFWVYWFVYHMSLPPGGSSMGEGPLSISPLSVLYPRALQSPWHARDAQYIFGKWINEHTNCVKPSQAIYFSSGSPGFLTENEGWTGVDSSWIVSANS